MGARGVGSQDRGRLGLVFLVAALVLMPVLVFSYNPSSGSGPTVVKVASVPPQPTAGTSRPPGAPAIVAIVGVGSGLPLRGSTQIYAYAEGNVGGVLFRVDGEHVTFFYLAERAPYLLDPHEPKRGVWDTAFVPNGEYTLTATSTADPSAWRAVRFIVRNS